MNQSKQIQENITSLTSRVKPAVKLIDMSLDELFPEMAGIQPLVKRSILIFITWLLGAL